MVEEGSLFVLGNLLLDMVASVDDSYLEKYDLQPDSIQMAQEKHLKIYEEIIKMPSVQLSPGGSALNSVRMAQEILKSKNAITLVGSVGSDTIGDQLIKMVAEEGIQMLPQVVHDSPTGKCASLLTNSGSARTMVTELGASLDFSHEEFLKSSKNFEWLEKAKCLYISGYFLRVSPKTVMEVIERVKSRDPSIPILLNLNAVWVTVTCKNELTQVLPYVDVLFGNISEATSLVEQLGLPCGNAIDIARELTTVKADKIVGGNSRTVLITRGEEAVICADANGLKEYPVPVVPKELILDTTGAGDAFVGGYLAQYVKGNKTDECVSCGLWAATEELKGYGFIVPKFHNKTF